VQFFTELDPIRGTLSFDVQVLGSFAVAVQSAEATEEMVGR